MNLVKWPALFGIGLALLVSSTYAASPRALEAQVTAKVAAMTLEQKVAQLFVVTPEALLGAKQVRTATRTTSDALKLYPVGGLVYFSGNLQTPAQLKKMLTTTQMYAKQVTKLPVFLSVDEEGGRVARVANAANFKVMKFADMATIGATRKPSEAYQVGSTIGAYLKQLGFNLDFAPVADVRSNPKNTVIGSRSFSADPQVVTSMAVAAANGLAAQQVLACFKHFPGHGDTAMDTHVGQAFTTKTLDQLRKTELIPFQAAAGNRVPFLMVSHIAAPKVTGSTVPASLSPYMVTTLLRGQLKYDGIIITDALNMGAIMQRYTSGQAAVLAVKAGADMLLMPNDFKQAYAAVVAAVKSGSISQARLDASVARIVRVKLQMK